MGERLSFMKREFPAELTAVGTDSGVTASGYFSLHFTYPDTAYEDPTDMTFAKNGTNQLGINFLIRTPLANDTTAAQTNGEDNRNGTNFQLIDLKRAAEANATARANGSAIPIKTFDLGTEEAARLIASHINSSRHRQVGQHSVSRYLRARYTKMSGNSQYGAYGSTIGNAPIKLYGAGLNVGQGVLQVSGNHVAGSTTTLTFNYGIGGYLSPNTSLYTLNNEYIGKIMEIQGAQVRFYEPIAVGLSNAQPVRGGLLRLMQIGTPNRRTFTGFNRNMPTDIPKRGTIRGNPASSIQDSGGQPVSFYTLTYDGYEIDSDATLSFNITKIETSSGTVGDVQFSILSSYPTWLIDNETSEQHTVVVSWEQDTPTGGGYWGTANGGPIVQGLGVDLPVWHLTAKPMDGGNMGLPNVNADSRGAQPQTHSTGHGYSRFSIEGLNSCTMPDMPPPDMPFDGPNIMGSSEVDPYQWRGQDVLGNTLVNTDSLYITDNEHGTELDTAGPFSTNCVVSANADITTGTSIPILTPATTVKAHFEDGDKIYTADALEIGTISTISETTPTGLTAVGPKNIDSGMKVGTKIYRFEGRTFNPFPTGNSHGTGDLSTILADQEGGQANAVFNLGDEVRTDSDTLIGTIPITTVVKRFAPGFGFSGCEIHTESGNAIEPSSAQDINTIVVDGTDPNLIYHEGERIYSEHTLYKTEVTVSAFTQNTDTITLNSGGGNINPLSAGQFGDRIKVGERIYSVNGVSNIFIGVVKSVTATTIVLHSAYNSAIAGGTVLYTPAYIGTISEIQQTSYSQAISAFMSQASMGLGVGTTVGAQTTTQLEFEPNILMQDLRQRGIVPGAILETNAGSEVGTIASVTKTRITLAENNLIALTLVPYQFGLRTRATKHWTITLASNLSTSTHTYRMNAVENVNLRLANNQSILGESLTEKTLTFAGADLEAIQPGTNATTINKGTAFYKPTLDFENATSTLNAFTTEHATTDRHLVVKSNAGIKSIDNQTYGGNLLLTDYVNQSVGNLAQVVDINGKLYGIIKGVLDERVVNGVTFSRVLFSSLVEDIPTGTQLYRAAPTITLTQNVATTLQHGEMLFKAKQTSKWKVAFEDGGVLDSRFSVLRNGNTDEYTEFTTMTNNDLSKNKAVNYHSLKTGSLIRGINSLPTGGAGHIHRPYRVVRDVNTERVKGLQIPNEERVFDSIPVVDDTGAELVLEGGSPFGTVIRDYNYKQSRIDPATNQETTVPSSPNSGIEPNLQLRLPSQDEIPGNILVYSGHDRVQAWRHLSWGMGGLSIPRPDEPGVIEAGLSPYSTQGEASQFDTNDMVLHFHPVRILHDTLTSKFGLDLNNTPGAKPSGTTRLFASHRLSDHVERGSVLDGNGGLAAYKLAHHRIRFGRQGHSFVTPMTVRGTPISMRRQLHRSSGSAYSLMFEAESEYKHWGFQSAHTSQNATTYYLDTLEVRNQVMNAGSFSADGLPHGEIKNNTMPFHHRVFTSAPKDNYDILFAPGQEHTATEGAKEQQHFVQDVLGKELQNFGGYGNAAHNAAVALDLATSRTVTNRHNAGEEFTLNGFILNQYLQMGGRPQPSLQNFQRKPGSMLLNRCTNTYYGHPAGWLQPRVGTELGTVPPLIAHDPDLVNASASPIPKDKSLSAGFDRNAEHNDLALVKADGTNSGATPDAFLCTWLAEYSHPALFGTSREHYMTFRYRSAGMPKGINTPPLRGLMLRNANVEAGGNQQEGTPKVAMPFERLYAFQWLQNYGYNGLLAAGHGSVLGQRAAGAVLMGHDGINEAEGTLELRPHFSYYGYTRRKSRGEGIGDGLNPTKNILRSILDQDVSNSDVWNEVTSVRNPMVAVDWSRRLPVRAFGFRSGSDSLNMLAGKPNVDATNQQKIQASGRFDGGIHDTMNKLPVGDDWQTSALNDGIHRTVPIGVVMSEHTNEAFDLQGYTRLSNDKWTPKERKVGMGRTLEIESLGMVSPKAMPAGIVTAERTNITDTTGANAKFLHAKVLNEGSDPILGNGNQATYKGNNLHLNAHPTDHAQTSGDLVHYPANNWGRSLNMKDATGGTSAERGVMPIPLSEIADHRQVQSDLSPRLGMVVETNSERKDNKNEEYLVTSTKAVSLHSDLAIGQHFPLTPSYVTETVMSKNAGSSRLNASTFEGTYGGVSNANLRQDYPQWCLNNKTNLGNPVQGDTVSNFTEHIQDHWAVRGCGDLPPWGGVYILKREWLEYRDNKNKMRSVTPVGDLANIDFTQAQASATLQPVRKEAHYIMRMVRPLKVFGWSSRQDDANDLGQDGWLLGGFSTLSQSGNAHQPFTRDKRYGMFELNNNKQKGFIEPITAIDDKSPVMTWPDGNDRDEIWHLIPSANMLQHFKSDAARRNQNGQLDTTIDARYSQSTHPGGGHVVSQTEIKTGLNYTDQHRRMRPYLRMANDEIAVTSQADHTMTTLGSRTTIRVDAGNVLTVEDATGFPTSGALVIIGLSGSLLYTSRTETTFIISSSTGDCLAINDLSGREVIFGKNPSATIKSTIAHTYPAGHSLVVLPSLVDNAITMAGYEIEKWEATSPLDDTTLSTAISYRGIGHYEPSDFTMLTPQRFVLNDGNKEGTLSYIRKPGTGGLSTVYIDGKALSTNHFSPYLLDASRNRWRISGAVDNTLKFRNLTENSLADSGVALDGYVRLAHYMSVGVRTTDAALLLLKDVEDTLDGADLLPYEPVLSQKMDNQITDLIFNSILLFDIGESQEAYLNAHPSLYATIEHSSVFTDRDMTGVGLMEVLRSLSQFDDRQLVMDSTGIILYSKDAFVAKEKRLGTSSGPQNIEVSAMLEMANHVIVEGERLAQNEKVRAEIKDLEKIKQMGGSGNENGVTRTSTNVVAGLTSNSVAKKMAKRIMNKTEQGASLIKVDGLVSASHIEPGEIIAVDFTNEGIKGLFAVFETTHDSTTGMTSMVIGQYEKGIEGLLADILSSLQTTSEKPTGEFSEQVSVSMSDTVRILSAQRILTRFVLNNRLLIGGRWRNTEQTSQLGAIGVKGGLTGVLKNGAINANTTTFITVDGKDPRQRFKANDGVYLADGQFVGVVASNPVSATQITLTANNLVTIPDNTELRVSSNRADPLGHSKSVFYEVR